MGKSILTRKGKSEIRVGLSKVETPFQDPMEDAINVQVS
jgi:hypothetical protein